jgi:hypothetical protein
MFTCPWILMSEKSGWQCSVTYHCFWRECHSFRGPEFTDIKPFRSLNICDKFQICVCFTISCWLSDNAKCRTGVLYYLCQPLAISLKSVTVTKLMISAFYVDGILKRYQYQSKTHQHLRATCTGNFILNYILKFGLVLIHDYTCSYWLHYMFKYH